MDGFVRNYLAQHLTAGVQSREIEDLETQKRIAPT
jgi:hypothetical protein